MAERDAVDHPAAAAARPCGGAWLRAIVAAALVGAVAYGWAREAGAPRALQRLTSVGASAWAARGGVAVDVDLARGVPAAQRAGLEAVLAARLGSFGGDATIEPAADDTRLRVTAIGADPAQAEAVRRAAELGGQVELREVLERSPLLERMTAAAARDASGLPPGVTIDDDIWTAEDSNQRHLVPFYRSLDRSALGKAIAALGEDPDGEIVIERVRPDRGARLGLPYWRTYVVSRQTWILDGEILAAQALWDPNAGRPEVSIDFSAEGTRRFGELTTRLVGHKLAILLDGQVESAPVVNGPIRGGSAMITLGGADPAQQQIEADALVAALHGGSLPVAVTARVVATAAADPLRAELARDLTAALAALIALAIAAALVRWPAVRRGGVASGRAPGALRLGPVVGRALVTVGVVGALVALDGVTAPGIDGAVLTDYAARFPEVSRATSIIALGVAPALLAALIVEGLALVIPRWRARRRGGPDERAPLTLATVALAACLALLTGYARAGVLHDPFVPDPLVPADARWTVAAALCAGAALFALGAAVIDRWGLGHAWATVIAFDPVVKLAHTPLGGVAIASAALVAVIALAAARARVVDARGAARPLAAGFAGALAVPLVLPVVLGPLAATDAGFWLKLRLTSPWGAVAVAVAIAVAVAAAASARLAPATRARVIALAAATAAALTGLGHVVGLGIAAGLAGALGLSVLADAAADARARARGAWSSIAITRDVERADALLAEPAAQPRVARGLGAATLLRGLAPLGSIEVLEAKTAAQAALEERLPAARARTGAAR